MELRKIAFKRPVKLLTLLLTSMIIATASAAVYNYMYMQSFGISAEAAKVQFTSTGIQDFTAAGGSIGTNGTYVKFTSMAGWPNSTRIYQDAVGIQNTAAAAYTIELKFDQAGDWSGDTTQVDYIYVKVFDTVGGTQQGSTITVGSAGSSTGSLSLPGSTTWHVQWEIKWNANAQSTHQVSVKLTLIVTGE